MNRFYCKFVTLVVLLASCSIQHAGVTEGTGEKSNLAPCDVMPVDSAVLKGRLENGLTYYIRENQKPEQRANLRLVVKAGSVLEDDDQQGLAHFAEHMAFNGTEHFEKQELVNYLESIGMSFGPEINAYTSFDETVYMLQVPTDDMEIIEKAFLILEDWAHGVSYEDEEIDRERGVIIEEWRGGRGASARILDKQLPVLFKDSRYAERLPIGKREILETFPHDAIRRFYRDWYRPDLMAVIAVGDFETDTIEKLIKSHFSQIPTADTARELRIFPVPDHDETLFAIESDPEATGSSIEIYYNQDVKAQVTVQDYRDDLVEMCFNSMFNKRLDELTLQSEPPFLSGYSGRGNYVRSKDFYILGVNVKEGGIQRGLEALLTEAGRIKRYGYTESELDRQKQDMLRMIERIYNERDKSESQNYTAEYTRNFLEDEPIPGIVYEYELYNQYIPGIRLEEVNALADEWIQDRNRVILVDGPEKPDVTLPSEEELLAVFDTVKTSEIQPYVDSFTSKPLIDEKLNPVAIRDERMLDELDVTEFTLANGVRIVLKPTDFKNDEVLFASFSPGGYSLTEDEDFIAALTASSVVTQGGVGDFDIIELDKQLTGKVVRVSPGISSLQEGLSGGASPQDLETMFQLIYLYFTAPRKDSTAYLAFESRMKGYVENRSADPETAFGDTVMVTMAQYHVRERPWTLDLLEEMNLETSYEIFRDRFADAGDFTFFFVGNFEVEKIKLLIQTYLGNLPSTNRNETWADNGIDPPKGVINKAVYRGLENKSQVNMIFTGPFEWSRQNRYAIQSMASVLRIRLREVLREDMGGTYGVGISASTFHYPDEENEITISFGTDPERVEEMIESVLNEISNLKMNGAAGEYLDKVKETQRRDREVSLKSNSFWLTNLRFYYYHNEDPGEILKLDAQIDSLSSDTVRQAARNYFNTDNYVTVVLYPENDQ